MTENPKIIYTSSLYRPILETKAAIQLQWKCNTEDLFEIEDEYDLVSEATSNKIKEHKDICSACRT